MSLLDSEDGVLHVVVGHLLLSPRYEVYLRVVTDDGTE